LLELCTFMLAVNYTRRQHTSINKLQPFIHLIIEIGQDRRMSLSKYRLREARRISIHTVNLMTEESQGKSLMTATLMSLHILLLVRYKKFTPISSYLINSTRFILKENVWLKFCSS
jgi:hypothetical protein